MHKVYGQMAVPSQLRSLFFILDLILGLLHNIVDNGGVRCFSEMVTVALKDAFGNEKYTHLGKYISLIQATGLPRFPNHLVGLKSITMRRLRLMGVT